MSTTTAQTTSFEISRTTKGPRTILGDTGIILKDQFSLLEDGSTPACFSCSGTFDNSLSNKVIPYNDILSVKRINPFDESSSAKDIEITFVRKQKGNIIPATITISEIDAVGTEDVVEEIYKRSYVGSKPKKSILVLINPHGGKGKALRLFLTGAKPILDAAEAEVEIRETQYYKHAITIAKELSINKYDIIACASGDGIPYEVFNGLYQRSDRVEAFNKFAITQIPCGSGNAMSESCHGTNNTSFAALSLLKARTVNLDLMAVTQDGETTLSFLSQTVGVIADADIGTEHLRFLGAVRFDLGVAYKILSKARYPCEISVKYAARSKDQLKTHFDEHSDQILQKNFQITEETFKLKYDPNGPIPNDWETIDQDLTDNLNIFYTGAMPYMSKDVQFFPAALPNDGSFDLVLMDSRTGIPRQAQILLSLDSGKHVDSPEVLHSKILAYRLKPKLPDGHLSIDGERYPFKEFQVEVLPGVAKTLLKTGSFVDTNF